MMYYECNECGWKYRVRSLAAEAIFYKAQCPLCESFKSTAITKNAFEEARVWRVLDVGWWME